MPVSLISAAELDRIKVNYRGCVSHKEDLKGAAGEACRAVELQAGSGCFGAGTKLREEPVLWPELSESWG